MLLDVENLKDNMEYGNIFFNKVTWEMVQLFLLPKILLKKYIIWNMKFININQVWPNLVPINILSISYTLNNFTWSLTADYVTKFRLISKEWTPNIKMICIPTHHFFTEQGHLYSLLLNQEKLLQIANFQG